MSVAQTLQADEPGGLYEVDLPAGQAVTLEVKARAAFQQSTVDLVNLSVTDSLYYRRGDTVEVRSRAAQVILPGNRNTETIDGAGTRFTVVCANAAKVTVARS